MFDKSLRALANRTFPRFRLRRRELIGAAGIAATAALTLAPQRARSRVWVPEVWRGRPFDDGTYFDDGRGWDDNRS